jgi:hypothetical protein
MAARGARIDPSAQAHLDEAINDWLGDAIGPAIRDDAKAAAPKRTGRLAESLISEVQNKVLRVGSRDCNYSTDVEMGTMPHLIFPNSKKALFWPGADHPVAYVNHPGTRPQPYLRPALFQRRTP